MARKRKPSAPAWPVEWFRVRIGPSDWRVVLSVPSVSRALDGAEGATEFATSTIYLLATLPPDRFPDVYVHEAVIHAAGYVTGLQRVMGWTDTQEESVATILAPTIASLLIDCHGFKLPPLPELPPMPPQVQP